MACVCWRIPSAGETAVFSYVCSATILDEFCSLLLSARFESADALLDIAGRMHFDDTLIKPILRSEENILVKGQKAFATHTPQLLLCTWHYSLLFLEMVASLLSTKYERENRQHSPKRTIDILFPRCSQPLVVGIGPFSIRRLTRIKLAKQCCIGAPCCPHSAYQSSDGKDSANLREDFPNAWFRPHTSSSGIILLPEAQWWPRRCSSGL